MRRKVYQTALDAAYKAASAASMEALSVAKPDDPVGTVFVKIEGPILHWANEQRFKEGRLAWSAEPNPEKKDEAQRIAEYKAETKYGINGVFSTKSFEMVGGKKIAILSVLEAGARAFAVALREEGLNAHWKSRPSKP